MFDENRLKDPGYFRENRLDPHSDHECIPSYRLSLNGLWKFFHAKNPAQVLPGYEDSPYRFILFALNWPREELYARIDLRVDRMIRDGSTES